MRKLIPSLLIASVLGLGAASALACPDGDGGSHFDRMTKKLELTTEQEAQFRGIMKAKHESMKSYHEEQRAKTLSQLSTVLTKEQLAKFEEMSERRSHHKEKKYSDRQK
ncbi:Zinc resistance-associated protein [Candidatus Nitrotoga sp. BS]|uniref:Spy/CpxP family protein refolding chaperone n=1 Tax=Candidatus Nitrotoga sp. BS TaxID=2890408 RepID=UPI001EF2D5A4|nr:hypothetical protein [Candidatus Nitrotoga sp. BS]CAH1205307.1 Zinc resistance-associated protein [Candidatus Nitrotoga sp. BS]